MADLSWKTEWYEYRRRYMGKASGLPDGWSFEQGDPEEKSRGVIYRYVRDTVEAGEKLLRKRVKRVASYLFLNFALTRGCMEVEEVFHGGKVGGPPRFS